MRLLKKQKKPVAGPTCEACGSHRVVTSYVDRYTGNVPQHCDDCGRRWTANLYT